MIFIKAKIDTNRIRVFLLHRVHEHYLKSILFLILSYLSWITVYP